MMITSKAGSASRAGAGSIVAASDEEKARAKKVAGYASRVNLLLSVPMIMCMASATHGLPL